MPDTLCIAELEDGRRALCYINLEERRAQLVLVLRPEDLKPRPWKEQERITKEAPGLTVAFDSSVLENLRDLNRRMMAARPLPIPPPLPPPRITPEDLLNLAARAAQARECPLCGCLTTEDACPICHYRFDS